ncbi:two-component system, OmpR family, sensor histidine kinase KdpD [Thermoflexales bacterium]|nr:two-component system, OmpR family, sensor histidine kinase KdpD [Thermoflexales bacterium]
MPKETILLISHDAELRTWLTARVLHSAGLAYAEVPDLTTARAKIAAQLPQLILLVLSEQAADDLAFVAEYETLIPTIVILPERSLELIESALVQGVCDVLARPLDAVLTLTALTRGLRRGRLLQERHILREQTDQQAQEFNALYTVSQKVAALFDIEEILKLVVTAAVNLTKAEEGSLMLLDANTGELYLRASCSSHEDAVRNLRVKVTDSLMGRVIQSGRPLMLDRGDLLKVRTSLLVKAIVGVPLIIGGHVIGVLSVYNTRSQHRFREHDVHLLSTLADSAAIAIRNAELYHDVRRTADRFAALAEIARRISESLDRHTVLERIVTHARQLLQAAGSEVYLLDETGQFLKAVVAVGDFAEEIKARPLRLSEGIVGAVARSGVAEMVNAVEEDPRRVQIPGTTEQHEALLCAPLIAKSGLLGVMTVVRSGQQPAFERLDFDFFTALAAQAVIAIENARLYDSERQQTLMLSEALSKQQELDRLKNTFIQNVSHELRTPLAIIRGYAELMVGGELGELSPEQHESAEVMARRTRMLSKMLDDLLTILAAETHKLEKELVDLATLTQLAVADFQASAKQAGLSLVATIEPDAPQIYADAIHMRRVLDNLLGNALKFTPAGGRVSVSMSHTPDEVNLIVSDTGIGISPEHLEKVFQRFYQVNGSSKRRYGGVGLGLALVKEIIESHDGQVDVTSEVGRGTTFRIVLPAVTTPPALIT